METSDTLRDISRINVDTALPCRERIARFAAQAGSVYSFRVGPTPVRVVFSPGAPGLHDALLSILCEGEHDNAAKK